MMEQVYRRQRTGTRRTNTQPKPGGAYKKSLFKESLFCLAVFIFCLVVFLSEGSFATSCKNGIRLIVNTQTDFATMPDSIGSFFRSLFAKDESQNPEEDLLANLVLPVEAPVTSPFGLRTHPTDGEEAFHYGLDFGAAAGDKIKCAAKGEATEVGESPEYGNYIVVRHSENIYTLYAHCQELLPKAGDSISAGQVIATVGQTGNATGPHLHFEIRDGDTWLDPAKFLNVHTEESKHD